MLTTARAPVDAPVFDRRAAPILFAALSLDTGGAERHLSAVAPALAARGWPVTIYCTNRLGVFAEKVIAGGVEVVGPPVERRSGPQRLDRRLLGVALAAGGLYRVLRRKQPRIVHFFLPEPYIVGAPSAILLRVPVRIMSRRGRNHYQEHWPGAVAIERSLHRRMTAVLANSRIVAEDLVAEGCDPDRVGLIYNGVGVEGLGRPVDRAAVLRPLGIDPAGLVMIVVASLIGYKGHREVLQALAMAAGDLPRDWSLVCVGRDEGEGASIRQQARELGIERNVRLLGARTDIPELLGAADISILASHEEGFSNAIIEAMAAGLPLVVSDVGGNAEAVMDGVTGLVVPPRDPASLSSAIRRLVTDPQLRARMGAAGRDRVATRFTLDACVDRYETLYRGLASGKGVGELPDVAFAATAR